jgi:hypothetical protein
VGKDGASGLIPLLDEDGTTLRPGAESRLEAVPRYVAKGAQTGTQAALGREEKRWHRRERNGV